MMSIPNILSVFRILLVGVFCYCHAVGLRELALIVVLLSGFSDILDGFIARKFNQITDLGKVLDPIADKLFSVTTIVCLCLDGVIGYWLLVLLVAKELFMLVGSIIFYKKTKGVIASAWYGKLSTVLFFSGFILALFALCDWGAGVRDGLIVTVQILLTAAIAMSLFAAVQYTCSAIRINRKLSEAKRQE